MQRLERGFHRIRIGLRKLFSKREHLFRMIRPDFLAKDRGEPKRLIHRLGIPRLARAKTVQAPGAHVRHHHRRRNGDQRHILVRIDSSRREPITQPHGMGAGLERHGENHRPAFVAALLRKSAQVTRTGAEDFAMPCGDRDCLSVAVENPRNHERLVLGAKLADSRGHGHAEKHVRRVRLAAHQPVAAGGPAPKLHHARLDSVLCKEPLSCATTIGAQSVRGRIPNVSCLTSGSPACSDCQRPATRQQLRQGPSRHFLRGDACRTANSLRVRYSISICLLIEWRPSQLAFQAIDGKALGIGFEVALRVESHAIKKRFRCIVLPTMRVARSPSSPRRRCRDA